MENPDFAGYICDEMLRKLSRWLRIAGYDVLSPKVDNDNEIAGLAVSTNRILITRDKDLSKMKKLDAIRIRSDDLAVQIGEFLTNKPVGAPGPGTTRCPLCNGSMYLMHKKEVEASAVPEEIPEKVLNRQNEFYKCGSCSKIYWKGAHWKRIRELLEPLGAMPELPSADKG